MKKIYLLIITFLFFSCAKPKIQISDIFGTFVGNIFIYQNGELVFVANRDSNHIVVFRRDPVTGALNYTGTELMVPLAVCVTSLTF